MDGHVGLATVWLSSQVEKSHDPGAEFPGHRWRLALDCERKRPPRLSLLGLCGAATADSSHSPQ